MLKLVFNRQKNKNKKNNGTNWLVSMIWKVEGKILDIYTLSRILGHSSVKVTEEAYLDLDTDDLRTNYQRFSPLANLKRK